MSPQEITDYKRGWRLNAYLVELHTDLRRDGIDYCKQYIEAHRWNHKRWGDVYYDTFYFQHEEDAKRFADEFERFVK